MTNNSLLSDFFATHDIDSLRVLGLESYNLDIAGVYCLHTGRLVGSFDNFVLEFACDEEFADSDEELVDALVTRCIASMRPSPMLNKPDRVTLRNLASKYPVDILSYLANRLHSNRWLATHRDSSLLDPYIWRIHTHKRWTELAAEGVDITPWIHWLLELDAKRSLHELTPPAVEVDRLGKWFLSNSGTSLLQLVTRENADALLAVFEKWTFDRLKEFDARDREAKAESQWMRGNSMTQPAYVQSWIENPQFATKRAEQAHKAKHKPAKVSSQRVSKINAKVSEFLHLLEGIMDGDSVAVTPAKPQPKVMTGAMLFKKKESQS